MAEPEIIQGLGRACSIGVLITFVATMLVIPVMSSAWPGSRIHVGTDRDLVQRGMRRLVWLIEFVIRRSRLDVFFGVLINLPALLTQFAYRDTHRVETITETSEGTADA